MTPAERDLIRRLAQALDASFTKSGHLAQRVGHEHLGYCSWRGCAPACRQARRLLVEAAECVTGERAPTDLGPLFQERRTA